MSTTHDQNSYDPGQPVSYETPPTEQGNFLWYCLGGCLVMMVLAVVAVAVLSYLVYTNGKAMAVNMARQSMIQAVNDSELEAADKREIIAQIDRVAEDYKAGKITLEQVAQIGQELAESPLLVIGMVHVIKQNYVVNSGLSQEEKDEANLTLQRAGRGLYEETISQGQVEEAAKPIMKTGPNGESQLKEKVTDQELREFLANLKQVVDEANIPEEEFKVEIGKEFRKAVDKVYAQ
jgi:hypothetical protein